MRSVALVWSQGEAAWEQGVAPGFSGHLTRGNEQEGKAEFLCSCHLRV